MAQSLEEPTKSKTQAKIRQQMNTPVFSGSAVSPHASPGIYAEQSNYPEGWNE
jgi:hypothetical protein